MQEYEREKWDSSFRSSFAIPNMNSGGHQTSEILASIAISFSFFTLPLG